MAVDFINGDAYDLDPELESVDEQGATASRSSDGALQIVLVDFNDLPKEVADQVRKNPM